MHQRLIPRKNAFKYDVYYLGIPLSQIESNTIGETLNLNRFGLHSFYEKDHGYRDGSSLKAWLNDMFDAYKIEKPKEVFLISMPRILGYVFNPERKPIIPIIRRFFLVRVWDSDAPKAP